MALRFSHVGLKLAKDFTLSSQEINSSISRIIVNEGHKISLASWGVGLERTYNI